MVPGDVVAAQQEAEGDQQAAAGHERDHVADAGEQRLLQLLADVLALFLGLAVRPAPRRRSAGTRRACGLSAAARASWTILAGSSMPRLTGALMTGLPAKRSLPRTSTSTAKITASAAAMTAGSSGLAPEEPWVSTCRSTPDFLGRGDERVGGHVGVGDAGGAGRDGDEALGAAGRCRAASGGRAGGCGSAAAAAARRGCGVGLGGRLVRQGAVDELHDFRLGGRGAQGAGEVLLDQRPGQLGQQLQVLLVRAVRGGDEEDQVRGAVLGAEVDRLGQPCHGQGGFGYGGRAAVRDGDAAGDAGGGLLLAGEGVGEEAFDLGGASVGGNSACQVPDHVLGRIAQVLVELDQFGGDELSHCQSFRRAVMVTASGVVCGLPGRWSPAGKRRRHHGPPPDGGNQPGRRPGWRRADSRPATESPAPTVLTAVTGGCVASHAPSAVTSTAPLEPRVASTAPTPERTTAAAAAAAASGSASSSSAVLPWRNRLRRPVRPVPRRWV